MSRDVETVFSGLTAKKADLIILILSSQHIDTLAERDGRTFSVRVDGPDRARALAAVDAYERENRDPAGIRTREELNTGPFLSGTAVSIMALLALIHALLTFAGVHEKFVLAYGSSSLFISQGQTFRAVTALFLHADAGHLLGNLAGMILLGAPLFNLTGYGSGPFMLLAAGTTGNLLTAAVYRNAQISIGASTAVMGAAGLLAAFHMTQKDRPLSFRSLLPVLSGAVLVALFSQGERTDVMAHVFGFASGFLMGLPFFPLMRMLHFPRKEALALAVTLFLLSLSFFSGQFRALAG